MRDFRQLAWRFIGVVAVALIGFASIVGTGGGGGDDGGQSNVPPPPPPPPAVQSGVFKDSNVSGLAFSSGGESGVTDADGKFTCETGNTVSFSIGGVDLGQTACATLVTPNQLTTDDATFDVGLANRARFLQMLDEDGDPDNGIAISDPVRQIAENWTQVDFLTNDLPNELVTIISDAASVDSTLHALPSEQDALVHLDDTLACAYAGAYAGSISGTNTGAAGMVIGWVGANAGFVPFGFDWDGFDSVNEIEFAGGASNAITVRQLPTISNDGPGVAGPIAADFTTPDDISGTWEGGTVELHRIGSANGDPYRFVGHARTSLDVRAYISLNFDGSAFSGQAFEVVEGTTYQVTGTLSGDAVSLTASGGGTTALGTGTLTTHPDGSPDEVQGTFDDGSTFSIVACRLN